MNKTSVSFSDIKKEILSNPDVKEEYDKLEPRYQAISQIIQARNEQHMTQADLAKKIGTRKSNISRLESGNYNPSLDFLVKVYGALGKKLNLQML